MYSSKAFTIIAVVAAVAFAVVAFFEGWDMKYYELFKTMF